VEAAQNRARQGATLPPFSNLAASSETLLFIFFFHAEISFTPQISVSTDSIWGFGKHTPHKKMKTQEKISISQAFGFIFMESPAAAFSRLFLTSFLAFTNPRGTRLPYSAPRCFILVLPADAGEDVFPVNQEKSIKKYTKYSKLFAKKMHGNQSITLA